MTRPLLVALLLVCCASDAPSRPALNETAPKPRLFAELAGEWSGMASIPGYGTAVGSVLLSAQGHGRYVVMIAGSKSSGVLRLLSWDGHFIEGEAAGTRERVPASLQGDSLRIEVPLVGPVFLGRQAARR